MGTCILIVDDEPRYLSLMEANLVPEGYSVLRAIDGQEAIDIVAKKQPDLVLLDIRMPVMDGFKACQRMREFSSIPIIMVTARGSEQDRIKGLDLGADDYIVKPFSALELLARVRAVLRRGRSTEKEFQQPSFTHGDLRIDFTRAEVFKENKLVFLSATELRILIQFAQNEGKVLTAEQLLSEVWGAEYRKDKEILWVSISRLRQKLETDPKNPIHILTRPGLGYTMPSL